jgi:hypothetical protein
VGDDAFDTTVASDEPREGGDHAAIERYRVDGELGRGGLGRVVLAFDEVIGREVAIKELLPGAGTQEVRFLREARLTGRLEHPGIVPVYEIGRRTDGSAFYTMKVVRGETLHARLERARTREERMSLLRNFLEVCHAVAYAHEHGVIHRDLKPANVMIGRFGETVVLDWGIAKRVRAPETPGLDSGEQDPSLTRDGAAVGTPHYMSPEQAEAAPGVDETTDVWSLGVMLFQILTGSLPFRGDSAPRIMISVRTQPAPDPRSVDRTAPRELAAVCRRCLAKDRAARFPNAKALADEIDRYLTGQLVEAYGYSRLYLAIRWFDARRRKAIGLSVLGIIAALLLALAVVTRFVWPGRADAPPLESADYAALSIASERARMESIIARPKDERNAAPVLFDAIRRCTAGAGGCDRRPWIDALDVQQWKRLSELDDPSVWIERSSVPEVDLFREASRYGRYEMWGSVILPHANVGVHRVPIPMYGDFPRLAWLGTLRAEVAERSGALEEVDAWYADLILAADHMESDAYVALIYAMNIKIGVGTRWAETLARHGRDASAVERFVRGEQARRVAIRAAFASLRGLPAEELERIARDRSIVLGFRAEALSAFAMRTCYGSLFAMALGPTAEELPLLEDDLGHPLLRIVQLMLVHDVARGFVGRGLRLASLASGDG